MNHVRPFPGGVFVQQECRQVVSANLPGFAQVNRVCRGLLAVPDDDYLVELEQVSNLFLDCKQEKIQC
jgi:hypothetical protein